MYFYTRDLVCEANLEGTLPQLENTLAIGGRMNSEKKSKSFVCVYVSLDFGV
jgi:hypothetical protein